MSDPLLFGEPSDSATIPLIGPTAARRSFVTAGVEQPDPRLAPDDSGSYPLTERRRRLQRIVVGAVGSCCLILVAAVGAQAARAAGAHAAAARQQQEAVVPPVVAAVATPPTPQPAEPAPPTTGTLRLRRPAALGQVWLDGAKVTTATPVVACGKHQVQVGSKGRPHGVDVPCGGEVVVAR
jgi:hypothetical protein